MDDFDPERNRDGDVVPWASVRSDYEAGLLTCNGIAHRYRLRRGQLDQRARVNKWVRPGSSDALDRQLLIARLQGLLERQMEFLEADMDKGNRAESKVLSDLDVVSKKVVQPLPWCEAGDTGVGSNCVVGIGPRPDELVAMG